MEGLTKQEEDNIWAAIQKTAWLTTGALIAPGLSGATLAPGLTFRLRMLLKRA